MSKHQPARVRHWQATIIITLFFIAVAGAAAIGWWYARESPPHQGPIVLISVDGLPADALVAYGGHAADMPGIDALAADSVVFDRAYTQSPQVLPAHASLLSGELPPEHGVRDDAGFTLKDDVRTLAELLRSRGFNTGAALTSVFLRRESGLAQGFTFFAAGKAGGETPGAVDAAERWARTQSGQRYFLLVQVERGDADAAVTRLAQLLKEKKLYDGATIILIGTRGRPGLALDEATLHVPLLIKQPHRDGAGRRVATPVQQVDLLPTILDFVRAPVPGGLPGRSLRKAIDNDTPLPSQPIYSESLAAYYRVGAPPQFAMTSERYRYVRGIDDQVVPLSHAPGGDDATAAGERLRTALDRIVASHPLVAPSPIAPAEEETLAAAGYLPGLPPTHSDDAVIEVSDEEKIADAHDAAARLAGERMFSAAITALQAIVRDHPALGSVHYQLGLLLARSGRLDEAIAPLKKAAELRPDAVDVPLALARVLLRAGRLDDAEEEADRAIMVAGDAGPAVASAHALAARVALARKDTDAATMHADAAAAADPGLPMPQFVRGRVAFDDGHYDAALAAFHEADAVTREHGTALLDLHLYTGESLVHLEQYADAETEFREELETFPHNLQAYSGLAMLYHTAGRDADIEDVVNQLVDAAPTPEGYGLAARLWTTIGDRSRAEALRSDARARFRGDPSLALLGRDARR